MIKSPGFFIFTPMEKHQLRIVFMGTPDFAVATLRAIIEGGYHVVGVITAPDKEAGRGKKIRIPAVKEYALTQNLKVLQPEKLKNKEFLEELAALKANLQVVVAFRMLPEEVWDMPELGTFNLHASLLPQYRGAAPINHVLINGEKVTGVTTFFLDKEIDTGRIIGRLEVPVDEKDDFETLHDRLMEAGARLVISTIESIRTKCVAPIEQSKLMQPGELLHPAPKICKDFCRINWSKNPKDIYNFIRGLSPYPCAFTYLNLDDDTPVMTRIFKSEYETSSHNTLPGTVSIEKRNALKVAVEGGYIYIKELQLPGKKRMPTEDFLRGFHGKILSVG